MYVLATGLIDYGFEQIPENDFNCVLSMIERAYAEQAEAFYPLKHPLQLLKLLYCVIQDDTKTPYIVLGENLIAQYMA